MTGPHISLGLQLYQRAKASPPVWPSIYRWQGKAVRSLTCPKTGSRGSHYRQRFSSTLGLLWHVCDKVRSRRWGHTPSQKYNWCVDLSPPSRCSLQGCAECLNFWRAQLNPCTDKHGPLEWQRFLQGLLGIELFCETSSLQN